MEKKSKKVKNHPERRDYLSVWFFNNQRSPALLEKFWLWRFLAFLLCGTLFPVAPQAFVKDPGIHFLFDPPAAWFWAPHPGERSLLRAGLRWDMPSGKPGFEALKEERLFAGVELGEALPGFSGASSLAFGGLELGPWSWGAGLSKARFVPGGLVHQVSPFLFFSYTHRDFALRRAYALFSFEGLLSGGLIWGKRAGSSPFWLGSGIIFHWYYPLHFSPKSHLNRDQVFWTLSFGAEGFFTLSAGAGFPEETLFLEGKFYLEKLRRLSLRTFFELSPTALQKNHGGVALVYSFEPPEGLPFPPEPFLKPSRKKYFKKRRRKPLRLTFQKLLLWGLSPTEALYLSRARSCPPPEGISPAAKKILKKRGIECSGGQNDQTKNRNHHNKNQMHKKKKTKEHGKAGDKNLKYKNRPEPKKEPPGTHERIFERGEI